MSFILLVLEYNMYILLMIIVIIIIFDVAEKLDDFLKRNAPIDEIETKIKEGTYVLSAFGASIR